MSSRWSAIGAGATLSILFLAQTREMKVLLLARVLIVLIACVCAPPLAAKVAPVIRVLIVDGFSNHDWQLTTHSIRAILEPTGLFSVAVTTTPPNATAPGWDAW